jgi:hypothetical protein
MSADVLISRLERVRQTGPNRWMVFSAPADCAGARNWGVAMSANIARIQAVLHYGPIYAPLSGLKHAHHAQRYNVVCHGYFMPRAQSFFGGSHGQPE